MITKDDVDEMEQKVEKRAQHVIKNSEHCKDGASADNTSRRNIFSAIIDAVSDGLGRATISNDNDDDDALFIDPPPKEDCPICMLPMPYVTQDLGGVRTTYQPCCGKTLCWGCFFAEHEEVVKGNLKPWCSLCRVPSANSEDEEVKRYKRRMDVNDAEAFYELGCLYYSGLEGLPKALDDAKCAVCGVSGRDVTLSNRKVCTSCAQKVETWARIKNGCCM